MVGMVYERQKGTLFRAVFYGERLLIFLTWKPSLIERSGTFRFGSRHLNFAF